MDYRNKQLLEQLFAQYYIHPECKAELLEILNSGANKKKIIRLFQKNTIILNDFGRNATKHSNFEKLKHAKGLYAMKYKLKDLNMRIIYTYKEGKLALLLCSFFERSDSDENYDKYIPVAMRRLEELREE